MCKQNNLTHNLAKSTVVPNINCSIGNAKQIVRSRNM